jgi:hypothetical protein
MLANHGAPVLTIAENLGQSDINVTRCYTHLNFRNRAQAANDGLPVVGTGHAGQLFPGRFRSEHPVDGNAARVAQLLSGRDLCHGRSTPISI